MEQPRCETRRGLLSADRRCARGVNADSVLVYHRTGLPDSDVEMNFQWRSALLRATTVMLLVVLIRPASSTPHEWGGDLSI